jgi:hypothetical protein
MIATVVAAAIKPLRTASNMNFFVTMCDGL